MKAYFQDNGTIRLFRPDMNMARMNRSAARILLPVSIFLLKSFRNATGEECTADSSEL
jgi:branched-subunit amino acid aminotransferase/4-amino-4-deoxychorismate lyase